MNSSRTPRVNAAGYSRTASSAFRTQAWVVSRVGLNRMSPDPSTGCEVSTSPKGSLVRGLTTP